MGNRCYTMLKPGVLNRRLVGEVISRLEKKGLKLVGLKDGATGEVANCGDHSFKNSGMVIKYVATEGKITDQEIALREGIYLKKVLAEMMAKNTGQSLEKIEKDMDRDNWMSAQEAKEYGMIDEVLCRKP